LALAAGCDRWPSFRRSKPGVVWIVLDTVRADHTSAHGHYRPTTPNLGRFLGSSTQYMRAIAPAPWTLPSHAAMFTGQYPFMIGMTTRLIQQPNGEDLIEGPLDDNYHTVAEALAENGYATAAFVANSVYMKPRYNLGQGFGVYDVNRVPAVELLPPALDWLDQQRKDPFFLFINIMDAHFPMNTAPQPGVVDGPVPQDPELFRRLIDVIMPQTAPPDEALRQEVIAQYDTGIANADVGVGLVLDRLRQLGLYDDTLIIVTSDHGEYLGEHGLVGHSKDVYEPTAHVPLAIHVPGQRRARAVVPPVSLVDLAGLILSEALGPRAMAGYAEFMRGNSAQFPVLCENHFSRRWDVFDERWGHRFRRERTAIYEWPWKYIASSDGAHELYQLDTDPAEQDNRIARDAAVAARLQERVEAAVVSFPSSTAPAPVQELTEEEKKEMDALGYLGSATPESL
jgi:arylsulfatase A-like enzyme